MSPSQQPLRSQPLRSAEQLVEFYRAQAKPRRDFRIGIEHEKIGFRWPGLDPLPFDGPHGIEQILLRLQERFGYTPVVEERSTIGLMRGDLKLSLEPGGQLEMAGTPSASIGAIGAELDRHLHELGEVSRELGCIWLALGENPFTPLDSIPWVPKRRYRIMREYMPRRGRRGLYMMKATATVQANLDYSDEEDACRKLRTAMGTSPLVTALFSNSSIVPEPSGGERGVAMDHRYLEWTDTDPDRCGLLAFVFRPDFGFRHYVEWLLDVPMYFLLRDGRLQDCTGQSFRRLMDSGQLDLADFQLHMTTAFPEVRLKSTVELRGADNVPRPYLTALPALWKGLLYDDCAMEEAWKLAADWSFEERLELVRRVGYHGLEATIRGQPIVELAAELLAIAERGLQRQGPEAATEIAHLTPLHERIRSGRSLAREVLDLWHGAWNRDPESLIAWARLV
jgi:glutamate--cysteine ligase